MNSGGVHNNQSLVTNFDQQGQSVSGGREAGQTSVTFSQYSVRKSDADRTSVPNDMDDELQTPEFKAACKRLEELLGASENTDICELAVMASDRCLST